MILRKPKTMCHAFLIEDAVKYGYEKAIILNQLHDLQNIKKEKLYEKFPYWEKEKFEKLLNELLQDKIIFEE